VQGDEPLLDPEDIRRVAQEKAATPTMVINCYHELGPDEDPESPNIPKVIFNEAGMMVYMSRRALPGFKCAANKPSVYHKQVCIYGFSGEDLKRFSEWGRKGTLEWHEDIEILRFLEIGVPVRMIRASRVSYAVDMPEDAAVVESMLRRSV